VVMINFRVPPFRVLKTGRISRSWSVYYLVFISKQHMAELQVWEPSAGAILAKSRCVVSHYGVI
jgi:hypothetical protein